MHIFLPTMVIHCQESECIGLYIQITEMEREKKLISSLAVESSAKFSLKHSKSINVLSETTD